ncbi:MAG TPA: hypothetical protein PLU43_10025, partial [Lachnospiraceae bacterium]|nr:hypothetical protein [Lachnospiraceae bacterium]
KIQYARGNETVYVCGSYKRYTKAVCSRHEVSQTDLEKAIIDKLNEYIAKSDIIINKTDTASEINLESIKKYNDLMNIVKIRKKKLFETLSDGLISKEEYTEYKETYDTQEKQYLAMIESIEQENKQENSDKMIWIKTLQTKKKIDKLDRSILADTVEKITVTETDDTVHVDIRFRFSLD